MKVSFVNVDPKESDTICYVHILPDSILFESDEDGKQKIFMHSLARFIKWLIDNKFITDTDYIADEVLTPIIICGADIENFSITFKKEKHMLFKEIFTILKHYASRLGLEYPSFMNDVDDSLFEVVL